MASRPIFLCLLCTIAALGSDQVPVAAPVGEVKEVKVGLEFATEPPRTLVAVKGRSLVLPCAAGDVPEGTSVSWLHDGSPLVSNARVTVQQNGSLTFKKIKHQPQSDQGLYQCKLSSSDGVSLLSRTSTLRVAVLATNFTQSPKNISIQAGDSARLSCHIEAVPTPLMLWERDGNTLPRNDRYQVLPSGVLLIDTVEQSDQGEYRCVASIKSHKRFSNSAYFEVVPADKEFRPPQILSEPTFVNVQALQGETIYLECGASGSPVPLLTWSSQMPGRKEVDLEKSQRQGTNVLVIPNISLPFSGEYICKAKNKDASGQEHQAQIRYNVSVQVPPTLVTPPQSFEYPIAKFVKLQCQMSGLPMPNITWYKNGELLHINGRIKQKSWTLHISNTIKEDSGIYQCRGWNDVGEVWGAARLTAGKQDDRLDPPTGLKCSKIGQTSLQLSWNRLQDVTAYTVHHMPTAGGEELYEAQKSTPYMVKNLQPNTSYTLYVRAYAKTIASNPSERVICVTDEVHPSAVPIVLLRALSPTSIEIEWTRLQVDGKISSHKLQYRAVGGKSPKIWSEDLRPEVHNYILNNLTPGAKYEVRVLSVRNGLPVSSSDQQKWAMIEMPLADEPLPLIPDVTIRKINATAVLASWSMPPENRIYPSRFRVSLLKDDAVIKGPLVLDSSRNSTIFNEIDAESLLKVRVQGLNAEGESGEPGVSTFQLEDYNEPPWSLSAVATSPNSIKLSWEGPTESLYSISCQPLVAGPPLISNSSKHSVLISDLKPYTTYELSVRMFNKNLKLGPERQKVTCQTFEDVPGPPTNLEYMEINSSVVRVKWQAPAEPNGKLGPYRVYFIPHENASQPLEKWTQISSNTTEADIADLMPTTYSLTVMASTLAGYGKASEFLQFPDVAANPSHLALLGILCGAVSVLIIIGVVVTFRLTKSPAQRSPERDIPHTNGNGLHHEGIDLIALSSNIPPAPASHLDAKGWYPTPKTNGAHSNGIVPNGVSTPLLTQVHITENPQFNSNGEGKNACPSCPGPGSNSRGCPSCQEEPLLAADVTQVTVLVED